MILFGIAESAGNNTLFLTKIVEIYLTCLDKLTQKGDS